MTVWVFRLVGMAAVLGAVAVALFASGMDARETSLGVGGRSWLLVNFPLVGVWLLAAALAFAAAYCFRAARRLRRVGIGLGAEELKLRNDPRFVEAWVQHIKTQPRPGAEEGTAAGPAAEGTEPPRQP